MRITNIEIKGFKSFPDKTVVNFDEAITGIVGPNGCGKSNIVDAIRWVVGEQKISSLRSENLENLVFNGSKTRSPSGLAEVKITFENTRNLLATEFNTVTIARRFYRTGESEYLINGVVCRLKDIQNLLLDTGISSDSYAIIELGMMDDIIRDKDNSRRRMLEQAAGISIFKTRKRETELKLQATDLDLNRLEDILFEINNQLKDLETQSRRAQRYLELRKQYKEISIRYAKWSLRNVSQTFTSLHLEEKELATQLGVLRAEISTFQANLEKEKLDSLQQEQTLRTTQLQLNKLDNEIAEQRNQKNLIEQQKAYSESRIKETTLFLDESQKQIHYLNESIQFTTKSLEEEKVNTETLQRQVEEKKVDTEAIKEKLFNNRSVLNQLLQESQKLQQERFDIEKQIALFDAQFQNAKLSLERRKQQNVENKSLIDSNTQQHQDLASLLVTQEEKLAQKIENTTRAKEQILDLQSKVEQERASLVQTQRAKDAKQNEVNLIKNLLETLDGYPDSVKYLYKNNEWEKGVLLSDVLFVKNEFRVCIERFLEPYMNYYVVTDSKNAYSAIGLLKKNNKGKVNFLVMAGLQNASSQAGLVVCPEGCFPAIEAVEVEEQYQAMASYLLRNVFIQTEVSDHIPHTTGATIIGRDGTWIQSDITLTGGSVGSFEGSRIGRKKNIEKLQAEVADLDVEVTAKNKVITDYQQTIVEVNAYLKENDTEQLKLEIVQTKERIKYVQDRIANFQRQQEEGEKFIIETAEKMDELSRHTQDITQRLDEKKQEEESQKIKKTDLQSQLTREEELYQQHQQAYSDVQIAFTKQQNKVNTLQNDLQYKQKQLQDIHVQIEQKRNDLGELQKTILDADQRIQLLSEQLLNLIQEREAQNQALNHLMQQVDLQRNAILEQEKNTRHLQSQKESLERTDNAIKEKIANLRLEMASIKERLLLEFKIDIEEMMTQENFQGQETEATDSEMAELKIQMEKIKRSLDNLGEVNPMAVEAYETHKKRYNFILQQKADLIEAKNNLLTTIQEVEQTVNQSFNETFNQVRTHFQRVFKKLFTEEDTADLVLDKPDNIYETGIDIIAKPKGKRPSSINQLSGGEKTLTSIALLFSLYLIKPAPFCVLDEVDAPLDDANVGKFTNMIREFSKDSQFIIVTHNKATMASVDVIYGITMQETGVSRLVPVDFRSLA